jgi:hypothetical protein
MQQAVWGPSFSAKSQRGGITIYAVREKGAARRIRDRERGRRKNKYFTESGTKADA